MVKFKISNRNSIQLATSVVAILCVAALRGRPTIATGVIIGAVVAVIAVQKLGKEYDKPTSWWVFLAALAATLVFVWYV